MGFFATLHLNLITITTQRVPPTESVHRNPSIQARKLRQHPHGLTCEIILIYHRSTFTNRVHHRHNFVHHNHHYYHRVKSGTGQDLFHFVHVPFCVRHWHHTHSLIGQGERFTVLHLRQTRRIHNITNISWSNDNNFDPRHQLVFITFTMTHQYLSLSVGGGGGGLNRNCRLQICALLVSFICHPFCNSPQAIMFLNHHQSCIIRFIGCIFCLECQIAVSVKCWENVLYTLKSVQQNSRFKMVTGTGL